MNSRSGVFHCVVPSWSQASVVRLAGDGNPSRSSLRTAASVLVLFKDSLACAIRCADSGLQAVVMSEQHFPSSFSLESPTT